VQPLVLDSPVELLASLMIQPENISHLLLISGPSGAGKTHWCLQLVDQARLLNVDVAGLVAPAVFTAGRKTRIDMLDLRTGQQRRLALRKGCMTDGLVVGAWELDLAVLSWGNALLQSIHSCQLLVLDELGLLEFNHNSGLISAFRLIESRCYRLACVGIRPSLLPVALERWPWARVHTLPARQEAA
jgi:nucleoside-triphosphatase THEP1